MNFGWKYGVDAGLLKRRVGAWPIYFFQGLPFSHLEITICKIKEKLFFSATIILEKKVILSCLKMKLKNPINEDNLFIKGFKRLKIDF